MDDAGLVAGVRAGDEDSFAALVQRYHPSLVRLASTMVPSRAVAEEVAQETWLAVLRGIDHFEERSSFRTWLFHILANRARSVGVKEHRTSPLDFDALAERFDESGVWAEPPVPWSDDADARIDAASLATRVRACLHRLPDAQRQALVLRDVEGVPADDVCHVLGISDGNLRVLLHRGRAHVRRLLAMDLGKA